MGYGGATRRGNLAAFWAGFASEPAAFQGFFLWQEIPIITRARLWVAYGTTESLERTVEYLDQELIKVTDWHLDGQRLEILALRSLALSGLGRAREALICLNETVRLASRGRWLRPFLEPGDAMLDLVEQLDQSDLANDSARQILDQLHAHKARREDVRAAQTTAIGEPDPGFSEPLTRREQEIHELIARRFQNKEIALRLSVSPETVKSHLKHLYSKLGVSNRREAAARFRGSAAGPRPPVRCRTCAWLPRSGNPIKLAPKDRKPSAVLLILSSINSTCPTLDGVGPVQS